MTRFSTTNIPLIYTIVGIQMKQISCIYFYFFAVSEFLKTVRKLLILGGILMLQSNKTLFCDFQITLNLSTKFMTSNINSDVIISK